jgi:hypothetical protein
VADVDLTQTFQIVRPALLLVLAERHSGKPRFWLRVGHGSGLLEYREGAIPFPFLLLDPLQSPPPWFQTTNRSAVRRTVERRRDRANGKQTLKDKMAK